MSESIQVQGAQEKMFQFHLEHETVKHTALHYQSQNLNLM